MWDALGGNLLGNYPPTNKNSLIRALTEECYKLPQQLLDNVVRMMQQPMWAKACCVHLSIRDDWDLRCMSICPDQAVTKTCLSINRLWHELLDMLRRLVGTTAPGHHDCSIQERKVSNHGSIPNTIDCNVVAFIVFEEVRTIDSTSP
ncbi:hypothetical protein TNCV_2873441 [Trichonephila clavipes]|nr:hypothetical protein TNCV_2873441 [Trichonephila clavipes]